MKNLFAFGWLRPAHRIVWALPTLALLASTLGAQAQPRYQALNVTGYNADVVANGTNVSASSVSTRFDTGGFSLMEEGYSNPSGGTATQGLPPSRIINSAVTTGLPFQLASYSASNSLRLTNGRSGTLTLSQPRALNTLYVLAATGSANTSMNVTVRFSDNSTQAFNSIFVPDWFNGLGAAVIGLGRVLNGAIGIENDSDNPRLYQFTLPLDPANRAKKVSSVSISNGGGGALNVMGLSAESSSDLIINSFDQPVPVGNYTNITIQNNGEGELIGDISVNGALVVENGGFLVTFSGNNSCHRISGPGSFTLAAGGYLEICDALGITASGTTGTIRTAGARNFSDDASYDYTAAEAQVTGNGLPATVRELYSYNALDVTLTQPVAIRQLLDLEAAGNLQLDGQALTLRSGASGTALVVNFSTGKVLGPTATVERYLDPSRNPGLGYRHYSAPVLGSTVGDLATAGFSPEVSQAVAYNGSATPGTTTPFPTVFGYDQSRVTRTSTYTPFDRGFFVPEAKESPATSAPLEVGRGYAVQIDGDEKVDFTGTLNTGNYDVSLTRVRGNADAGWALVGNPYPSPIDGRGFFTNGNAPGLDQSFYVVESEGPYSGMYRSFVKGFGGAGPGAQDEGNPFIAAGQGFFVRVSEEAVTVGGRLQFRNAQRVTNYGTQVTMQRGSTSAQPTVGLALRGTTGPVDKLFVYADAQATAAFDSGYDAWKLSNSTGLNLSSRSAANHALSIDGRPAFTAATRIALAVGVPTAGTYTLSAASLTNLPAGLDAYLSDAATGQTIKLAAGTTHRFSVSAAESQALLLGRFTLSFSAASVLASASGVSAGQVSVYPNPASGRFTVSLPAIAGARTVEATLLNSLGQVVRRQSVSLSAGGTRFDVVADGLGAGVYSLRLTAGAVSLTKRVVLQ